MRISKKSDLHRITVLLDCISIPDFSNRIIRILNNPQSGIVVEYLSLPVNILLIFRWPWILIKSHSKIVHYLWGDHHPLVYIFTKILGKKVIVHWVGTDVMWAISKKRNIIHRVLRTIANRMIDMHLTVFEPLSDELETLGIKAKIVPLIPDMSTSKRERIWPQEDRVLVYLPEKNQDIYGKEDVFRLAHELSSVDFLITYNNGEGLPKLPNVKYLGIVDNMDIVWEQIKLYLRLTKHDGLSHTVLEALARGKHVVWTQKFPYCHQGRTFNESKDAIMKILSQNQPNIEGMEYVNANFEPSKILENLKQKYLEVLS